MIRSMTGFGRGTYEIDGRKYIIEIKSVKTGLLISLIKSETKKTEEFKRPITQISEFLKSSEILEASSLTQIFMISEE